MARVEYGARYPREQLVDEEEIVWLEDPAGFAYVREGQRVAAQRRNRVRWSAGRTVGYAVLRRDARNNGQPGSFPRRVFWVMPHDRHAQPDGVYSTGCPSEAVDPLTVAAGQPGRMTERAWGAPLPRND